MRIRIMVTTTTTTTTATTTTTTEDEVRGEAPRGTLPEEKRGNSKGWI